MLRSIARASVALLLAAAAFSVRADSYPALPTFGDASIPVDLSGQVTLPSCIAQALGRNFTVRIQEFSVFQAVDNVAIQQATYEPTFGFTGGRQVTQTPTNELALGEIPFSSFDSGTFSVTDTLLTGGTVTASYELLRADYKPAFFLPDPACGKHGQHQRDAAPPPRRRNRLRPGRDRDGPARASGSPTSTSRARS